MASLAFQYVLVVTAAWASPSLVWAKSPLINRSFVSFKHVGPPNAFHYDASRLHTSMSLQTMGEQELPTASVARSMGCHWHRAG